MATQHLNIERILKQRSRQKGKHLFERYSYLKRELLENEYLFTLHAFRGGTDHGPEHIQRVLEYLDKLVGKYREHLSDMELYFVLCSTLLHDQGLLHGREEHARISERLLKLPEYRSYFNDFEMRFLGRIVAVHSSGEKLEEAFRAYDDKEDAGGDTIRLRYIAALLRLADELDEDHRRAKSRIFNKILLPQDSIIFWLMNLSIQSVNPVPSRHEIKITVEYSRNELRDLYVFQGEKRVNTLAGIFRKVQKLNDERRYCARFLEDGLRYKKICLRLRDYESGENIDVTLDDDNNGEVFFTEHSEIFCEQPITASPTMVFEELVSSSVILREDDVILWQDITEDEQANAMACHKEFISDALEIVERPDLYGRWHLLVYDLPDDPTVAIHTDIFVNSNAKTPVSFQVFPVGEYPLSPPEITVSQGDTPYESNTEFLRRSGLLGVQATWVSKYGKLGRGRLTHIADTVAELQNPVVFFCQNANEAISVGFTGWYLKNARGTKPILEYRFNLTGKKYCISIRPGKRYPMQEPKVVCTPIPDSDEWLDNGELNWEALCGETDQESITWKRALFENNPLAKLMKSVEAMLAKMP